MVFYGIPSKIGVRHSLRWRIPLPVGFLEIDANFALAAVVMADTYSVVMVAVRF